MEDDQNDRLFNNPKANEDNIENVKLLSEATVEEISIYDVFSKLKHNLILFWISITVLLLPFSDTAYLPVIDTIARDLKTSDALVNLSISLYLLFVGLCSLVWGVISDRWGRNITMRIGLTIFFLSSLICIFTRNIIMLLIIRIFQGGSVSVTMVVGQSIIADIYPPEKRGWITGIFFIPILLGVVLGPTLGGILAFYFGWRSIFVFQSLITLFILIIYILIIPETHQYYVMIKTKTKKIIESDQILKPVLTNPFLPFIYLTNLSIIPYIISASTAFASIIINQCLLAIVEANRPYYYNELKIGISYIPLSIGEVIGCILGGYFSDRADRFFKTKRLENRLIPGTIAYLLVPIGLVVYGWAFQYRTNILVPILSATVVAFGQAVYRPAVYSYLTVKEQQNSATVSSANNSLNFIFASIALSVAAPIIEVINSGPFYTLIAFINIMAVIPTVIILLRNIKANRNNYQSM